MTQATLDRLAAISQVVIAFVSLAAVLINLYQARRLERPRLVFPVELWPSARGISLVLTVANIGLLPVHIHKVVMRFPRKWTFFDIPVFAGQESSSVVLVTG